MDTHTTDGVQVFRGDPDARQRGRRMFWLGVGLIAAAIVAIGICVIYQVPEWLGFVISGPPFTAGILLQVKAQPHFATHETVRVEPDGISVEQNQRTVGQWRWDDIAYAAPRGDYKTRNYELVLVGLDGREVLSLSERIENFGVMVDAIHQYVDDKPTPKATTAVKRTWRKKGLLTCVFGLFFSGAGITLYILTSMGINDRELFDTSATPTTAVIVEKFTAPNGTTRRIYFRVTSAPADAPTVNVAVDPDLWDTMAVGDIIEVDAVPGRPDVAHLAYGEIISEDTPFTEGTRLQAIGIIVVGALFALAGLYSIFRGVFFQPAPDTPPGSPP